MDISPSALYNARGGDYEKPRPLSFLAESSLRALSASHFLFGYFPGNWSHSATAHLDAPDTYD